MLRGLCIIYLIGFPFLCRSQWNQVPFREVCDFIYTGRNGITYLSSINGWYVFSGLNDPLKLEMPGLENKIIQSNMLEGRNHMLWFSTYNRIIRYNPLTQKMHAYALTSWLGDTLNSDYYAFHIDTIRNQLWVKQASKLFLFDTENYTSELIADSVSGRRILNCEINGDPVFLSYYYTQTPHIVYGSRDKHIPLIRRSWSHWPSKCMANDMAKVDDHIVLIAGTKGLFMGDIITGELVEILPEWGRKGVICIQEGHQGSWLVSFRDFGLKWLDWNSDKRTFSLRDFSDILEDKAIQRIVKDRNGILFLVSYEKHIYFGNPLKRKFKNFNIEGGEIFPNTKLSLKQMVNMSMSTDISSRGTPLLIEHSREIYSPPPYTYSQTRIESKNLIRITHPESKQIYRYFTDEAGNIYGSFLGKGLFQLNEADWTAVPYPGRMDTTFNSFYALNSGMCIACTNQESLVTWNRFDPDSFLLDQSFSGDVYSFLLDTLSRTVYAATDQGVLKLDHEMRSLQILDATKGKPCYCILQDLPGNLWLSSPDGIFAYFIHEDRLKQFDTSDGVSTIPYWPRKCARIANDSLIFFYPGGVTLVSPSHVDSLHQNCVLRFSNFKVNDVLHSNPSLFNYADHFSTTFSFNELEFDIQAVDLSNPHGARLQYILEGYDREWERPEGPLTRVRYPKLPPGQYTLRVKGANADGVWNKEEQRIFINVEPPFWQKWWFVTLMALISLGICYWIVRIYYRRKLERKNQLLREQALLIEKQQAVERERTRIASEMHDDLGSGLTTIRYLSDKALTQVKDAEEAEQIKRIAEHSNALVRNMSEIIWAMNARFDNAESLVSYLRRYASEYLEDHQQPFHFTITDEHWDQIPFSGERRRNIFLVFKELLHNTVKYACASNVDIRITTGEEFEVRILEKDAMGFDPETSMDKGNGLFNMKKRMDSIGGNIYFRKLAEGMEIIISLPLQPTQHGET